MRISQTCVRVVGEERVPAERVVWGSAEEWDAGEFLGAVGKF